jgi:hypothetical protein
LTNAVISISLVQKSRQVKALQSPTPPRHLVLGHAGLDNVEKQLRSLLEETNLWKATSLGADYPTA